MRPIHDRFLAAVYAAYPNPSPALQTFLDTYRAATRQPPEQDEAAWKAAIERNALAEVALSADERATIRAIARRV